MARNRKRMALYEVIGKASLKANEGRVEQLRPTPEKEPLVHAPEVLRKPAPWPAKPKRLLFGNGSIEMSIPYPVAITIFLAVVTMIVIAFWLGQLSFKKASRLPQTPQTIRSSTPVDRRPEGLPAASPIAARPAASVVPASPVVRGANNRIVIKEHSRKEELEPAKAYFDSQGIKAEILTIGGSYFLVTVDKYRNFAIGSDGYDALRKVTETGAKYVAPAGREGFGPRPFHDAYGKKFDD